MRKVLALATATAAAIAMAATASPAMAAEGTTTVALTVADGELVITTTAAATGVSSELVGTGRVLTSPLGLTTVTDTRSGSTGWTLSARTTAFTHSTTTANTIPASAAKFYVSGAPTKVLGTVSYTPTTTPSSTGTLVVASASGVNTTEVSPVLRVDVPDSAITGLYNGTVTQSVV